MLMLNPTKSAASRCGGIKIAELLRMVAAEQLNLPRRYCSMAAGYIKITR